MQNFSIHMSMVFTVVVENFLSCPCLSELATTLISPRLQLVPLVLNAAYPVIMLLPMEPPPLKNWQPPAVLFFVCPNVSVLNYGEGARHVLGLALYTKGMETLI
jgi:hypothetical protein